MPHDNSTPGQKVGASALTERSRCGTHIPEGGNYMKPYALCGDEQVMTGTDDPETIGNTVLYYGNDSLQAAVGSPSYLEVYGTDGSQDRPRQWEGFGEYKLLYLFRKAGLDYLGNETLVRTNNRNRACT